MKYLTVVFAKEMVQFVAMFWNYSFGIPPHDKANP